MIPMSTDKETDRRLDAAFRKWRAQSDPYWLYTSMDPDAVFYRVQQGEVDADIEGLARDEGAADLIRRMSTENLTIEVQGERLRAYFAERDRKLSAAE